MQQKTIDKSYKREIIFNYSFKIAAILLGLVSTRLNIKYLGNDLYGLWATVISIVSWFNLGDLGISNGFRNELAKAIGENDSEKIEKLTNSVFSIMLRLSVVIFVVFIIVINILFFFQLLPYELRLPIYITGFFFCVNFVLGAARSIAYANQLSWLNSLVQFVTVFFSVIGVLVLILLSVSGNLILYSLLVGIVSVFANLSLFGFLKLCSIRVKINFTKSIEKSYALAVVTVGVQFFILQICGIILDSTDNLIINSLFGSSLVAKYSVVNSIYSTGDMLYSIVLISLWSAVTIQMTKGNYVWIKAQIRKLHLFWILFSLGVIGVSLFYNQIVFIWLDDSHYLCDWSIVFVFCVYEILVSFGSIYVNITNGLNRIKIQVISAVIGSALNIPLSIILAKSIGLGLAGVKLATLISRLIPHIAVFIDVNKYLSLKNIYKK